MSVEFKDNSSEILANMSRAQEAALIKIGIAAKRNIQSVIVDKDIYDTGELHRTIDYNVRVGDKAVDIGSPKKYAPFQELGTVRMKEYPQGRPFIRPGIFNNIDEYKNIAGQEISATMK